jgi:hypothetical protein
MSYCLSDPGDDTRGPIRSGPHCGSFAVKAACPWRPWRRDPLQQGLTQQDRKRFGPADGGHNAKVQRCFGTGGTPSALVVERTSVEAEPDEGDVWDGAGCERHSTVPSAPAAPGAGRSGRSPGRGRRGLVVRGMVIRLNGGTTSTEGARALGLSPELSGRDGSPTLTVVTNALNIAHEPAVRPNVKIVVTGGSPPALVPADRVAGQPVPRPDHPRPGVPGRGRVRRQARRVHHHGGEASINRLRASRARHVVVIADSGKPDDHASSHLRPGGRPPADHGLGRGLRPGSGFRSGRDQRRPGLTGTRFSAGRECPGPAVPRPSGSLRHPASRSAAPASAGTSGATPATPAPARARSRRP